MKSKFTIAHKNYNNLGNLFSKLKAPTKKQDQTWYIAYLAKNAPQITSVNRVQYVKKRIEAHKYRKNEITALAKHAKDKNHNFNFEKFKILDMECNLFNRNILEMVYIQIDKNSVNNQSDISSLKQYLCKNFVRQYFSLVCIILDLKNIL